MTIVTDKVALTVALGGPVAAVGVTWVDIATGYAQLGVAVASFVGVIWASLYHYERWSKLRDDRKEKQ